MVRRKMVVRVYTEPESEKLSSTFSRFSLGAGVTPAQGSVKPTAGFTLKSNDLPFQIKRCRPSHFGGRPFCPSYFEAQTPADL
jgi:hypothetical protein